MAVKKVSQKVVPTKNVKNIPSKGKSTAKVVKAPEKKDSNKKVSKPIAPKKANAPKVAPKNMKPAAKPVVKKATKEITNKSIGKTAVKGKAPVKAVVKTKPQDKKILSKKIDLKKTTPVKTKSTKEVKKTTAKKSVVPVVKGKKVELKVSKPLKNIDKKQATKVVTTPKINPKVAEKIKKVSPKEEKVEAPKQLKKEDKKLTKKEQSKISKEEKQPLLVNESKVQDAEASAPKKRGRKSKAEKEQEVNGGSSHKNRFDQGLTPEELELLEEERKEKEKVQVKRYTEDDIKDSLLAEVLALTEDFTINDVLTTIRAIDFFKAETGDCLEKGCDNPDTTSGYCRFHYIKNWSDIKKKQAILESGKLLDMIHGLTEKFPMANLDAILSDLVDEKSFFKVLKELNVESVDDNFDEYSDDQSEDDEQDIAYETRDSFDLKDEID